MNFILLSLNGGVGFDLTGNNALNKFENPVLGYFFNINTDPPILVKRNVSVSKSIYNEQYRQLIHELKAARIEAGITQAVLAKALGKPQSYVAKVEGFERRLDVIEFIRLAQSIHWDPFPALREIYGKTD